MPEPSSPSTAYADTLTGFDAAQAALAATPTRELLRAAYALTHRMDALRDERFPAEHHRGDARRDLRHQRDMIDAEIQRRTGDLPDGRHLTVVDQ